MNTTSSFRHQKLYRWTRDLHLYAGLFVSPFVLIFGGSIFFLNHATVDMRATTLASPVSNLRMPADLETARGRDAVGSARAIVEQVGVSGETGTVTRRGTSVWESIAGLLLYAPGR